ncbi:MAG TPA: rhomboid-like protein [Streptosporangiaceae bacterium]|nr:rhomboid-like protein [Streptosporangiaceae bacterium]
MRRPTARGILVRYAVAWSYLAAVIVAEVTYALLPGHERAALLRWASTNVHNLQHDPAGSMIVSAFFPQGSASAWPALIALALFGANRALGNRRTAAVCAAGHVIGTLVSEGILDYRVAHGVLPQSSRYIIDVGPSYVVVAAIAAAVLYGGWLARAAAVLDFVLLAFVGDIFAGLGDLDVAAVGHVTALAVGALGATLAVRQLRRRRHAAPAVATSSMGEVPRRRRAADRTAQRRPPA